MKIQKLSSHTKDYRKIMTKKKNILGPNASWLTIGFAVQQCPDILKDFIKQLFKKSTSGRFPPWHSVQPTGTGDLSVRSMQLNCCRVLGPCACENQTYLYEMEKKLYVLDVNDVSPTV